MKVVISPLIAHSVTWSLAFAAFVISAVSVGSCAFVSRYDEVVQDESNFGLFLVEGTRSCIPYSGDYGELVESLRKAAMAMGALAAIFGGIASMSLTFQVCITLGNLCWKSIGTALLFSFLCQALTFIVYNDPQCKGDGISCRLGEGGVLSIIACILYFAAGLAVCILPAPEYECITCDFSQVLRGSNEFEDAASAPVPAQTGLKPDDVEETTPKSGDAVQAAATHDTAEEPGSKEEPDQEDEEKQETIVGDEGV